MGRVTSRVTRSRVDLEAGTWISRPDTIAVEEPLEMRIGHEPISTTMRTPGHDFDLTIGHLLTEGLISCAQDVGRMMHCTDTGPDGSPTFNVVSVTLSPGITLLAPPRPRTEAGTSACGVCGSASIDVLRTRLRHRVRAGEPVLSAPTITAMPEALRAQQPGFATTGGMHAAGLFTAAGEPLMVREDVGRHNAVDKVVGALARERGLPFGSEVLVVSARASFEIVQKAAMCAIPVVVAVGAPSSLAVELAIDTGITLVAFARHPRMSIYSHPVRVGRGSGLPTG